MGDDRQYAPATLRNRDFILDVLRDVLPMTGVILEVASGSGEHIVHFARNFPALVFQPSDSEPDARLSVAAWVKATGHECTRTHCPGRIALSLADRIG
jgi:tRNA G46 methylase TrmB